jgi:hypothetical protein
MGDLIAGAIVAGTVFAGGIAGLKLCPRLPRHHQTSETRDIVRLGIGMLSVLASLVLGLLIARAKESFDTADERIRNYSAGLILLDRSLRNYGQDTDAARRLLREYTSAALETTWPEIRPAVREPLENAQQGALLEQILQTILSLKPSDDNQRWLRQQALEIISRLMETRWALLVGETSTVSPILLGIVTLWVAVIFASFGLNAPRNGTVVAAFFVCAVSIGGAIFVIREMDRPFEGIVMISGEPMRNALAHLSE